MDDVFEVRAVGRVESSLTELADAPNQGDEGAPDAVLVFDPAVARALADVAPGDRVVVLTWLDRADRGVLEVHPQSDARRPLTGVFSTRSPARPNPIGLHEVVVAAVDGLRVTVHELEAIHGTPVIDVKWAPG